MVCEQHAEAAVDSADPGAARFHWPRGRVLVTGASGFIGRHLVDALSSAGAEVRRMVRRADGVGECAVAELGDADALARACAGVDVVFHCAGAAHLIDDSDAAARLHHEVNALGTQRLVDAAARAGASGFVFLSSVKAMGAPERQCIDETWPRAPETAYGRAKLAAEEAVRECAERHGIAATSLRLAMVYGRGSRGNLERMARAVRAGWFPPLPETGARRSVVYIADVVSALIHAALDARAAGRTYIVADPQPYSGREIYDAVREALGLPPPRWRCPAGLLQAAARMGDIAVRLGAPPVLNSAVVDRLLGAECYSPARIDRELGWRARFGLHRGLEETLGEAGAA